MNCLVTFPRHLTAIDLHICFKNKTLISPLSFLSPKPHHPFQKTTTSLIQVNVKLPITLVSLYICVNSLSISSQPVQTPWVRINIARRFLLGSQQFKQKNMVVSDFGGSCCSLREMKSSSLVGVLTGRWFMVFASLLIMAVAGATYMFGLYSSDIKTSLGYDQSTLNLLSFSKDVGGNVGVLSGLINEITPPWVVLAIGSIIPALLITSLSTSPSQV